MGAGRDAALAFVQAALPRWRWRFHTKTGLAHTVQLGLRRGSMAVLPLALVQQHIVGRLEAKFTRAEMQEILHGAAVAGLEAHRLRLLSDLPPEKIGPLILTGTAATGFSIERMEDSRRVLARHGRVEIPNAYNVTVVNDCLMKHGMPVGADVADMTESTMVETVDAMWFYLETNFVTLVRELHVWFVAAVQERFEAIAELGGPRFVLGQLFYPATAGNKENVLCYTVRLAKDHPMFSGTSEFGSLRTDDMQPDDNLVPQDMGYRNGELLYLPTPVQELRYHESLLTFTNRRYIYYPNAAIVPENCTEQRRGIGTVACVTPASIADLKNTLMNALDHCIALHRLANYRLMRPRTTSDDSL